MKCTRPTAEYHSTSNLVIFEYPDSFWYIVWQCISHFVNHGICIYEEIILQFFAVWPKIVCWIPENLREKISALIFSSITLFLQGKNCLRNKDF